MPTYDLGHDDDVHTDTPYPEPDDGVEQTRQALASDYAARNRPTNLATGLPDTDTPVEEDESDLAAIANELAAEAPPEDVWPVPGRSGWQAAYRIDVRAAEIDSWRKRAKTRRGVDAARFASIALAELNTRLYRRDRPIILDGEEQTFRSRPFMDALGVTRATEAVGKVYGGLEGQIDATLRAVLKAAGWADELEDAGEPR